MTLKKKKAKSANVFIKMVNNDCILANAVIDDGVVYLYRPVEIRSIGWETHEEGHPVEHIVFARYIQFSDDEECSIHIDKLITYHMMDADSIDLYYEQSERLYEPDMEDAEVKEILTETYH